MISPTDAGFSDADIKGLKLAFSQSCSTANEATTSSGLGITLAPVNYRTGLQFSEDASISEQRISPCGNIWTESSADVKGKGIARSLDWHLATMASNDREREGSYLICCIRHYIDHFVSRFSHPSPLTRNTMLLIACTFTEMTYKLLERLPRSVLASLQRRMTPLLQFDVVGVSLTFCVQ
jgi:F-box and WD-40 domain protein 1/11